MQIKSIAPIIVLFCVVASLLVPGCTSYTSTKASPTNTPSPSPSPTVPSPTVAALEMVAFKEPNPNANVIRINTTIFNNHAGTFKLSTDNYYLTDSSGTIYKPINTVSTSVSDSDTWQRIVLNFQLKAGATPKTLRYYDGTHDINCTVT